MKIVHIILGKANPERMNGVNKVVYQLATKQAEKGLCVAVWGITKKPTADFPERNFATRLFKKNSNPFAVPAGLKNAVKESTADTVFHLHGGWVPVYPSLSSLISKHKKIFVLTAHGAYNRVAMQKSALRKKIYYRLFEKKMLQTCRKIHCIGESEVAGLHALLPEAPTVLIPYGYDLGTTEPVNAGPQEKMIFGFVGRLDIYTKGLDLLLDAYEAFSQKTKAAELWIVGDGAGRSFLEKEIAARRLEEKVLLLGSKFGQEKTELLQQMHVFVHPSRNEGLPISVIEAAGFGIPCLVSSFTNVGENIEKYRAGMHIKEYSALEFTSAMHALYYRWKVGRDFGMLRENAVEMVKKEYNWNRALHRIEEELYGA